MASIKKDISNAKSGGGFANFFGLKGTGAKCRIRFLQEFEEGMEVVFHEKFKVAQHPCLSYYGKECPNCGNSDVKTVNQYIWQVYNYETKKKELFMFKANKSSPVPSLININDEYGTITDRDLIIVRNGEGTDTTYSILPGKEGDFSKAVKMFKKKEIFEILIKTYNMINSDTTVDDLDDEEDDEDEEEEVVILKKKKGAAAGKKKKAAIVEDDDDEDDDEEDEIPAKKAKPAKKKRKKDFDRQDLDDDDDEDEDDIPFDIDEDDEEDELPAPKKKKKKK